MIHNNRVLKFTVDQHNDNQCLTEAIIPILLIERRVFVSNRTLLIEISAETLLDSNGDVIYFCNEADYFNMLHVHSLPTLNFTVKYNTGREVVCDLHMLRVYLNKFICDL